MNNLYKIILISVSYADTNELSDWESYKESHPNVSKEDYEELKQLMSEETLQMYAEDVMYSLDINSAKQVIKANVGDMSQEGAFNYGVVLETPLDTVYPDMDARVVSCYKYNFTDDCYDEIPEDFNTDIERIMEAIIPERQFKVN